MFLFVSKYVKVNLERNLKYLERLSVMIKIKVSEYDTEGTLEKRYEKIIKDEKVDGVFWLNFSYDGTDYDFYLDDEEENGLECGEILYKINTENVVYDGKIIKLVGNIQNFEVKDSQTLLKEMTNIANAIDEVEKSLNEIITTKK